MYGFVLCSNLSKIYALKFVNTLYMCIEFYISK